MIEHAYIHIPFCLTKCNYCSFVSFINTNSIPFYLDSLNKEIFSRYNNEKLKTLYIGGGTPSLLTSSQIEKLLKHFNFDNDYEITIEVNPEKMTLGKLKEMRNVGINRISIGIQTFNDDILKSIGRKHNSNQAIKTVNMAKNADFKNISIDLIYGLPNQTTKIFQNDLMQTKKLEIQHISTYGLKIEKGCYFCKNTPKNLPDDELQAEMYNFLCDYLTDFNHYEISNFSKTGFESKHNCAYWLNKEYFGFGLNSSGYENNIRYRNTSNLKQYIQNPFKRDEEILLNKQEILENEIFLALRLKQGLNITQINHKFNIDFMKIYSNTVNKFKKLELLEQFEDKIYLTRKGILLSNEVMSEFINI